MDGSGDWKEDFRGGQGEALGCLSNSGHPFGLCAPLPRGALSLSVGLTQPQIKSQHMSPWDATERARKNWRAGWVLKARTSMTQCKDLLLPSPEKDYVRDHPLLQNPGIHSLPYRGLSSVPMSVRCLFVSFLWGTGLPGHPNSLIETQLLCEDQTRSHLGI